MYRKLLICIAAIAILFLIAAVVGIAVFFTPWITRYVDSDSFRGTMETETAKGLHFPAAAAHYAPIRRTGLLTAWSESFQGTDGQKALKSINAHGITARFNPWGLFARQWRFDDVRVQSGEIEIQIYEANPEAVAPKPWFSIFLPNRVNLRRIEADRSDVTWRFRGERAGFFGTQLLITPHGPDFEYVATGGKLKMVLLPDLELRRADILITKTLVTIYDVDLATGGTGIVPTKNRVEDSATIHAEGHAGIGKDQSVDLKTTFDRLLLRTWLSAKWKRSLSGNGSGEVHWAGDNPQLESSAGEGALRVRNGRIDNMTVLEKLAELTRNKGFEHLELTDCSLDFAWRYPKIDIRNIQLEEKGKFRIEGAISIERRVLRGAITVGLTPQYLDWLPNAQEVFSRQQDGYLWTSVHLSGTIDQPNQDLGPRIVELFKKSPGAYLGLLFRQFEDWLKNVFSGDR